MRWDGELPTEVRYQIEATRGDERVGQISGPLSIAEVPRPLIPNFGVPMPRSNFRGPIVIEAVVAATLNLQITPRGLLVISEKGAAPAGMEDEQGRYLLVNGRPWYPEREGGRIPLPDGGSASLLPIVFGGREPQFRLLWARQDVNSPHDGARAALTVRNDASQVLFTASVRNQAPKPTRVALAITLDPLGPLYEFPPPRSGLVLESHWPLNDNETDQAADLGSAKRHGLTSVAQSIPGVRGSGIRIDRSPIFCPGVLPVERTEPFSCSAWIKPYFLMEGAVFGRTTHVNYRGIDLLAASDGSLQARRHFELGRERDRRRHRRAIRPLRVAPRRGDVRWFEPGSRPDDLRRRRPDHPPVHRRPAQRVDPQRDPVRHRRPGGPGPISPARSTTSLSTAGNSRPKKSGRSSLRDATSLTRSRRADGTAWSDAGRSKARARRPIEIEAAEPVTSDAPSSARGTGRSSPRARHGSRVSKGLEGSTAVRPATSREPTPSRPAAGSSGKAGRMPA